MESIGAFEAKTHLSSLLERVERGETFTITRHGRPVARLSPVEHRDTERIRMAIQRMKQISAGLMLGGDWRDFRDEGRKW